MNAKYTLPLSDPGATLETAGGKGASLARLARAGLPVPDGFHITTHAYQHFVSANQLQPKIVSALAKVNMSVPVTLEQASQSIRALFSGSEIPAEITHAIVETYGKLSGNQPAVAVRSSATAEDLPGASFAGQQETYLNVCGAGAILASVKKCWASLWTSRAIAYRLRKGIPTDGIALAVVVQLLVPAEAAGVLFTANPVNGCRGEAVISASWGLGEAIVGGLVTPDSLTVDKATRRILERKTSVKQVMTVRKQGGTAEQPMPANLQRLPVLDDKAVVELIDLGVQVENLYGMPMDIEWAWVDGKFSLLQARPVTALTDSELAQAAPLFEQVPVLEWKLPKGCYAAMRNNIVELMADPLTPLFATLGLSAINTSLTRLVNESFAMSGILPDKLIVLVNQYAYFNGSVSLKAIARMLFGVRKILKMMFTGAVERWTENGRPRYYQTIESWQAKDWSTLSSVKLVDSARQLTESAIDAYGALVSGVIPAAWITEALFTKVYNRLAKRQDDPSAPTYLLGYDSIPIQADKSLYSLAEWAREQSSLANYLESAATLQLAADLGENTLSPKDVPLEDWKEWRQRFNEHLRIFGHALYDLDFAHPVPADDPTPVLEAFKLFLRGQGANPYTRQRESAERREQAVRVMQRRLKGLRLKWFNKSLAPAQKYAPLREDGLAEIGLAYPLIRQILEELGHRFAGQQVIPTSDDIFWLTQDEVLQAAAGLDAGQTVESLAEIIPARKAEHRAAMRAKPPMALPQMKVFGFDLMSLKENRGRGGKGDIIKGVAASPGKVTGTARVLHSPEDFSQMKSGDVLVASITTPAWTPLFTLASAVVTDVGGPLSHGSIVAREYGIPAVLGTGVATRRIHSGQRITVDGSAGIVSIN